VDDYTKTSDYLKARGERSLHAALFNVIIFILACVFFCFSYHRIQFPLLNHIDAIVLWMISMYLYFMSIGNIIVLQRMYAYNVSLFDEQR
jgi:hypothetical protein